MVCSLRVLITPLCWSDPSRSSLRNCLNFHGQILSDYPRCYLDAHDPLHAFQGYGSVDAREMPLELGHAGSLAPRGVNLANSFGNRAVYSERSARMIRP